KERRTKNSEDHEVDLCPQALAMLGACPRELSSDGYVFTTNGKTQVSGFSKIKMKLDAAMRQVLETDLVPWRIHDLRRTMATHMGDKLDIDQGVIERCLNHISGTQGGLVGIYQRQQYREKRRKAFHGWGEFLDQLIKKEVPKKRQEILCPVSS